MMFFLSYGNRMLYDAAIGPTTAVQCTANPPLGFVVSWVIKATCTLLESVGAFVAVSSIFCTCQCGANAGLGI